MNENTIGPRLGLAEQEIARHDERLKTLEIWIPKIQVSIDSIHKSFYKLAGIFIAISIVAQAIFKFWPK